MILGTSERCGSFHLGWVLAWMSFLSLHREGTGLGQPPFISLQASLGPMLLHCWWFGGVYLFPSFLLDEFIQSRIYAHTSWEGAQVSVLLSHEWVSQGASPTSLCRLSCHGRSPKYCRITTVENRCELLCARDVAVIPVQPLLHSRLSSKTQEAASLVLGLRSCDQQGKSKESEQATGWPAFKAALELTKCNCMYFCQPMHLP